jgi:hypothetical protein
MLTGLKLGRLMSVFSPLPAYPYSNGFDQAASQRMIRTESRGKIILVSSILGWMSMIGYTTYSPAKFALRGL